MAKSIEQSAELIRKTLCGIDLKEIDNIKGERITDLQLRTRANASEIFYKNHFEKVLKLLIQSQLEWIGTEATDGDKLQFGRGSLNGLLIISEWFDKRIKESTAGLQQETRPVPGEAIPPTGKFE